jgi:putative transcriptional regulator|nr:MAG TPA: Cro/C1-type HTH DNA-binding domain protein [Caudoviricetes sp.]
MIRILLSTRLGERKWTQADLARMTGIRPSTINEYYHEIAERINLDHLDLMCEALDCKLSDLIVRVPNDAPRIMKTRAGNRRLEK